MKAAEKCGILAVRREEGAELVPFDATMDIPNPAGSTVRKFTLARPFAEADKVVSLAKMKTYTFMGITGVTKNMFGFIVGMQKAQFHLRMQARPEFAAMLIDLAGLVKPVSIVDGVVGMEGNGPRNGRPVDAGVLLAGADCFAVDVVMAELMGFDPARLPLTALTLERGLTPPLAGIELVGSASGIRRNFAAPASCRPSPTVSPPTLPAARLRTVTVAGGKIRINYGKCIRCYRRTFIFHKNPFHIIGAI